LYPVFWVFFL